MPKRKHGEAAEPMAVPEERTATDRPSKKKSKTDKPAKDGIQSGKKKKKGPAKEKKKKSPSQQRRLAARAAARGEEAPPSVVLEFDDEGNPIGTILQAPQDELQDDYVKLDSAENEQETAKAEEASKKNRFIVFIGNLPYTTTDEALAAHFASVKPAAIRHITKPVTDSNPNGFPESKGYAFVEFEDYDRLKTCLRSFHRTNFTCAGKTRQINVELTAGGGGTGQARKEKVRAKNEKLGEERKRRMVDEAKKKAERLDVNSKGEVVEKKTKKEKKEKSAKKPEADVSPIKDGWGTQDSGGMHPSRLALMSR